MESATTLVNASEQDAVGRLRLCFRSLFDSGRGYAFPCDAQGRVELEALSGPARRNYLHARAMVGRELATPVVEAQ